MDGEVLPAPDVLRGARRALCIGIGGGGDVVGTLAAAGIAAAGRTEAVLGGLTWERGPIDPLPGPRRLAEGTRVRPLPQAVALAGPGAPRPGGVPVAPGPGAPVVG